MPELGDNKQMVVTYPSDALSDTWSEHADDLDMSVSQFIIKMVEAGRKQITIEEFAADSLRDLRQQRNALQNEVARQRERIEELDFKGLGVHRMWNDSRRKSTTVSNRSSVRGQSVVYPGDHRD